MTLSQSHVCASRRQWDGDSSAAVGERKIVNGLPPPFWWGWQKTRAVSFWTTARDDRAVVAAVMAVLFQTSAS